MASNTHALFVPECHADTALMVTLLRENPISQDSPYDFISHGQGIGNVGRTMNNPNVDASRRVVGMVDLDVKFYQQPYLSQFILFEGSMERKSYSHALLRHPTQANQFLIVLNHACDSWVWQRAAEARISLAAFELPTEFTAFKKYCKKRHAELGLRPLLAAIAVVRPPAYGILADFVAQALNQAQPLP